MTTLSIDSPAYASWLESESENLKDMWESMGLVEGHEEGGDFETFCKTQFEDSRDFSNSTL